MTPHLADTPVLETPRLTLRAPRIDDYPAWEAFYRSDRARYVGGPGDLGAAWRAFAHMVGMWALRGTGPFVFADRTTDFAIGNAGPWFPMDWPEPEIGWVVWTEDAEGRGYAREATEAARAFAYETLGWCTAVSYIDPANARSIALAERLGCTVDTNAPQPEHSDRPPLVYRHPAPEALR